MGLAREEEVEIYDQPLFMPGAKVRARKAVKNDGTMPGCEIGEIVVRKGDEGYVRDVGTYLQRFYIYAVEFLDCGRIVGMRGRELIAVDAGDGAASDISDEQETAA
ncbi:nitrogen fixation protein NifZ [Afifella aestuarii]|uniref:nitrogen fixation protein NifZ n=1 Tax=Afifella aestuarii TaxID=1909496 RepID=UPI000FE329A6|nr:nitrogen fixation protein NifZ [Afifella aestuarii]